MFAKIQDKQAINVDLFILFTEYHRVTIFIIKTYFNHMNRQESMRLATMNRLEYFSS